MTDIGNDLLYGVPPGVLQNWIERCLDQLAEAGSSVVVTQLPIANVETITERRFLFYRRLFFPNCRLTLDDVRAMVRSFNDWLVKIGEVRKISVISVPETWYGLDPIHIRRRQVRTAWPTMFESWRQVAGPLVIARGSSWMSAYLASLAPIERSFFGVCRRAAQPSGTLADGTTISLY